MRTFCSARFAGRRPDRFGFYSFMLRMTPSARSRTLRKRRSRAGSEPEPGRGVVHRRLRLLCPVILSGLLSETPEAGSSSFLFTAGAVLPGLTGIIRVFRKPV